MRGAGTGGVGLCHTAPVTSGGPTLSWACSSPMFPPAAPESNREGCWYNVTVVVKMDFKELQQVDPRLLDHMRLLHSMVGAGEEGAPRGTLSDSL